MLKLHIPVTGFSGVDLIGQAGLEGQYDNALRGTPGIDEVSVDAAGQVTGTIKNTKPIAGDDLVTSINPQLQVATESALQTAVLGAQAAGNPGATSGAAVVMTTTGRIVAMASYPTYDPSVWSGGISSQQFQQLFGTGHGEPILERATQGQYFPGSTWKVTTTTAAVNAGYSLDGSYGCPGSITDVTARRARAILRHGLLQLRLRHLAEGQPSVRRGDEADLPYSGDAEDGTAVGLRQADRHRPAG
jgi:penicillin-binding protein 2